jgi:hypothetical protein
MQSTSGQRSREQRGGDRDYNRDNKDRVDKDGFRSALPRPDVAGLKRDIAAHDKEIAIHNKELSDIRSSQEKIRIERNGGRQEFENARRAMGKLMNIKKALHAEKSAIEVTRDASFKKIGVGQEKEKAAKSAIKFSSVEAIDNQIKELEKRQARTSMSLTEEKNLVKEITALTISKKSFGSLLELKAATDRERALKSGIDKKYSEKNGELKEIYKKIDAQKVVMDAMNKTTAEGSQQLPAFKQRQGELHALIEAETAAIKALRGHIKEREEAHAEAVAAEKALFKEELAVLKQKEEAEELARHPYEEEMRICDFLITYLSTKCVQDAKSEVGSPVASSTDSSAFAGMRSLKRDDDEQFMGGVAKKKGKKKGGQNNKDEITHTHESLEQFSSVHVTAPAKVTSVSTTLKELSEKKEYFNGLERGAIPSLRTTRASKQSTANKPAATGTGTGGGKTDKKGGGGGKKSVFNMESKSEYPGL